MLSRRGPTPLWLSSGPHWGSGQVGRAGFLGPWVHISMYKSSELDYPLEQRQNPPHQRLIRDPSSSLPRATFQKFWKEASVLGLTMVAMSGSGKPGHGT